MKNITITVEETYRRSVDFTITEWPYGGKEKRYDL